MCQRWWVHGYQCTYHRPVVDEQQEEDEEEEEERDEPDEDDPWKVPRAVPAFPRSPTKKREESKSNILERTVPLVVAQGVLIPTGGGGKAPVLVPVPAVVFDPFKQPVFIPPTGPGALVPGGIPPPPTGGGGFNVFDVPDRRGPSFEAVSEAIGIAIAFTILVAVIIRAPTKVPQTVVALEGRLPPLPFFPLFQGIKDYADREDLALALAEQSVVDSINESLDLSMLYQADFKERQLQDEQTAKRDEPGRGPRPPLLVNAIEKFAGYQLPQTAEFDWASVGLTTPP